MHIVFRVHNGKSQQIGPFHDSEAAKEWINKQKDDDNGTPYYAVMPLDTPAQAEKKLRKH